MAERRPLNYTTKVPARRSVAACLDLLADAGAEATATQYADKVPVGLSFTLPTPAGSRHYALPVNVDGVQRQIGRMLAENPPRLHRAELAKLGSRVHAIDVAWRVLHDWLAAQLAIIAAGAINADEVMLPWMLTGPARTVAMEWRESGHLALEAGQ